MEGKHSHISALNLDRLLVQTLVPSHPPPHGIHADTSAVCIIGFPSNLKSLTHNDMQLFVATVTVNLLRHYVLLTLH